MPRLFLFAILLALSSLAKAVTPDAGLWAIDIENNGQPGRGFMLETQGNTMVLTFYGYKSDGSAQWYLTAGPISNGYFTGSLDTYSGGMTFGANQASAHYVGSSGTVSIAFSDSSNGVISLPGEAQKAISRLRFAGTSGTGVMFPSVVPSAGDYFIFVETQASSLPANIGESSWINVLSYKVVNSDGSLTRRETGTYYNPSITRTYSSSGGLTEYSYSTGRCSYSPPYRSSPPYGTYIGDSYSSRTSSSCTNSSTSTSIVISGTALAVEQRTLAIGSFTTIKYSATRTSTSASSISQYLDTCWVDTNTGRTIPDFDTFGTHFSLTPCNGAGFQASSRQTPRYMDC
jgi:hypothetical protein